MPSEIQIQMLLSRMDNSNNYIIYEVNGIKVEEESPIITLEMLTELEKNGGWLQLPSTPSLYHMKSRYLIGDAYVHWTITIF